MAAATPMLAVLALVALPLAMTFESTSSEVMRLRVPAVVTAIRPARVASAFAVMIALRAVGWRGPGFVGAGAVVLVVGFCLACAVSVPPSVRSGPVPIDALVVTFEIAIAT